jgi:hypothetical protein
MLTSVMLPGGSKLGVYQPRHASPPPAIGSKPAGSPKSAAKPKPKAKAKPTPKAAKSKAKASAAKRKR